MLTKMNNIKISGIREKSHGIGILSSILSYPRGIMKRYNRTEFKNRAASLRKCSRSWIYKLTLTRNIDNV